MAKLHKEVRELVEKVEPIGWTFTGEMNGKGHPVMRHESGQTYTVPGTPGDWRSLKNSLSTMERIAGEKTAATGKRRASHKGFQGSGFSIEDAKREQAEFHRSTDVLPVADLWSQRRQLITEMVELLKCHTDDVDQTNQAATLLWKIRASERALKQLGQSVRDFDLMDLPLPGHVKEAAKTKLKKKTAPKPDPKVRQISDAARKNARKKKAKVDDFDGTLLLPETEPWTVALMGKTYDLYLGEQNRQMIETFLLDLLDGAKIHRKPQKKTAATKAKEKAKLSAEEREAREKEARRVAALAMPRTPDGVDSKVIREWLRNNGFPDIGDRGRFSAAHLHAWNHRNKRARRLAQSA